MRVKFRGGIDYVDLLYCCLNKPPEGKKGQATFSHKLLRWLVPYFLIALLAVNLLLLDHPFNRLTMALQIAFYALAVAGYLWQKKGKLPRILGIPFSFCLVNLAALVGVARFLMGKTSGRWVPVR